MNEIYIAEPVPIGQEPKKRNALQSFFYNLWWLIRGNMTIKKQIIKNLTRKKQYPKQYKPYETSQLKID